MKGGLLHPTIVLESLTDIALHIGRHRTDAVVVLVVAFAGIDMDEVVLDGTFHTARHIIIDSRETDGHTDRLILAEQGTSLTLHLWIVQIDTVGVYPVFGFVISEDAVEAVLAEGADCTIADTVVICLLCKKVIKYYTFLHYINISLIV